MERGEERREKKGMGLEKLKEKNTNKREKEGKRDDKYGGMRMKRMEKWMLRKNGGCNK